VNSSHGELVTGCQLVEPMRCFMCEFSAVTKFEPEVYNSKTATRKCNATACLLHWMRLWMNIYSPGNPVATNKEEKIYKLN